MAFQRQPLGHGIGLRTVHYPALLSGEAQGKVDWLEAISENYLEAGGRPLEVLESVRRDFPIALHGVSLSIGSTDPLNRRHLRALQGLIDRIQPVLVSDHLCWGSIGGRYAHDLLPLPFTQAALKLVVERVERVQETLGRQILLENVSSYLEFVGEIPEWEFLAEVARRADCGILLDINNIYVSAHNHDFSADDYLKGVPVERVGQLHLAGHQDRRSHLFDSHDRPVIAPVWALYRKAVKRLGTVPTLIEWDESIPALPVLIEESTKAARWMEEITHRSPRPQAA